MTATPRVSIVTPAYNAAGFIAETIVSVLSQTFSDFELLIVDDGSTDDTLAAARAAARGDSRVIVLANNHGGQASARNMALGRARGEFIALLDSDDVWMPQYLSEQLSHLHRHSGISVVTANAISRGGALDGRPIWDATSGTMELSLSDLLEHENAVCIMSIFRRNVVERIGGFDPVFTGNEDYEFWIRAMNAGFRVLQNRAPLGFYRRRPDSVSADEIRMLNGIMYVLEEALQMRGRIERERSVIARKLAGFGEQLVRAEVRSSLIKRDGVTASRGLRKLSRLRHDWRFAAGAHLAAMWPSLAVRAYELRCAWRSAAR